MKISVIVPVYNAQNSIGECLRALRGQEVLPDEVIIVDNNSTDASLSVIKKEGDSFIGVDFIIFCESKKGPSAARNKGAYNATGDILAFTDADCFPRSDWIKNIKSVFELDSALGMVGGVDAPYSGKISLTGSFLLAFWESIPRKFLKSESKSVHDFLNGKIVISFNFAIKNSIYKLLNGFDESFIAGEDLDFLLRNMDKGTKVIVWDPDIAVCHMQNISLKRMISKNFSYGEWFVYVYQRHFQHKVILQLPGFGLKEFSWKSGSIFISSWTINLVLQFTVLVSIFMVSRLIGIVIFLFLNVFLSLFAYREVLKKGVKLTMWESFLVVYIGIIRSVSYLVGKVYGAWRRHILCV